MKIIRPAPIHDGALVSSTVPETYPVYDAGATYGLGAIVRDPVGHRAYESVQGGNVGHALVDLAWWLDIGSTNRWRMFDQSNGSQTTAEEEVRVDLLISGRVNSVALLNCEAASARIIATVGATVVYDTTFALTSNSGITNWFDYFFEPIVRKPDIIIIDLPTYSNMAISVIVTRPGGTVKIGTLVVGQTLDLGFTLQGMSAGIIDYSRKTADDFGNYVIVERAFSKKLDARVVVENGRVDNVVAVLTPLRATPVVWLASTEFATAAVFGFYRNFSVTFEYPTQSLCLLEIEGLT